MVETRSKTGRRVRIWSRLGFTSDHSSSLLQLHRLRLFVSFKSANAFLVFLLPTNPSFFTMDQEQEPTYTEADASPIFDTLDIDLFVKVLAHTAFSKNSYFNLQVCILTG